MLDMDKVDKARGGSQFKCRKSIKTCSALFTKHKDKRENENMNRKEKNVIVRIDQVTKEYSLCLHYANYKDVVV